MAYYNGSVNNFSDLLTALVNTCVAEGWTWADGILNKGVAYVRPYVSATYTGTEGPGLIIQGGTSKSAGALVDPSDCRPRIGRVSLSSLTPELAWPSEYYIHVHQNPDEVYLILRTNVDQYYFLSFGVSNVPGLAGTGLWIAGSCRRGYGTNNAGGVHGWSINPTGMFNANPGNNTCAISTGFLWRNQRSTDTNNSEAINAGIDGVSWNGGADTTAQGALNAVYAAVPHIGRSPNAWNGESALLPIQGYVFRASLKCSLVMDVGHARYVRLDNCDPQQIMTLGSDKWKVYPFYKKNSVTRDGAPSAAIDHTGTFGWAIRYDGP